MIVMSVSVSLFLLSGSTDEIASAADAQHIPVAPPLSIQNCFESHKALARMTHNQIVDIIANTNTIPVCQPSANTSENAIRKPIRATPIRSIVEALKSIPELHRVFLCKNHVDIPRSKATSITGTL